MIPYTDWTSALLSGDTSHQAKLSIEPFKGELQERVYDCIAAIGEVTCDRVEALTGLAHTTASARVRELVLAGRVYDTGKRAKTRSGRSARLYAVRK